MASQNHGHSFTFHKNRETPTIKHSLQFHQHHKHSLNICVISISWALTRQLQLRDYWFDNLKISNVTFDVMVDEKPCQIKGLPWLEYNLRSHSDCGVLKYNGIFVIVAVTWMCQRYDICKGVKITWEYVLPWIV